MIEKTGVPTRTQILKEFPDLIVLKKPKAIIECYKDIPCNPCDTSCPFDAIHVPQDINQRPQINFDKCTGCGVCVYHCPGLAITVRQIKADKAILKIPYEFVPLPQKDAIVKVLDRSGKHLTDGLIKQVRINESQDKTAIITIEIEAKHIIEAMTIEVPYGS